MLRARCPRAAIVYVPAAFERIGKHIYACGDLRQRLFHRKGDGFVLVVDDLCYLDSRHFIDILCFFVYAFRCETGIICHKNTSLSVCGNHTTYKRKCQQKRRENIAAIDMRRQMCYYTDV